MTAPIVLGSVHLAGRRSRAGSGEGPLRPGDDHAASSVKAAKARWTIEKGAALKILVDQDLCTARGRTSLAAYADEVLYTSRDNVYKTIETIEAVEALQAVLAAPRVSKIFDTPQGLPGQGPIPVLALDSGEDKAVEIVTDVKTSGKKVTAAALTVTAKRLGYTKPVVPAQAGTEQQTADAGLSGAEINTVLTGLVQDLRRALSRVEKLPQRYTAAAADQTEAARTRDEARRLLRQITSGLREGNEQS
ncbi:MULTISPECIES: hypothetical protein [unclassified Streptomyces]|uniref:hypothetical protein n=1 Tax=unclassified Streptomyces TaxID=2593676 RepID=UPI0035D86BDD